MRLQLCSVRHSDGISQSFFYCSRLLQAAMEDSTVVVSRTTQVRNAVKDLIPMASPDQEVRLPECECDSGGIVDLVE